MNRVFKTRFFSRWMRKTELTEEILCDAVLEMIHGLIDADLGGGIIKKGSVLQARENGAVSEQFWLPIKMIAGFLCLVLKKTHGAILTARKKKR